MVEIFTNTTDLINSMIELNSSMINDKTLKKLPISSKYFLTMFDTQNDTEINNFFSYITDDTRMLEFPFVKNEQINYSMMLEIEQFYNIDLDDNTTIKTISDNIDEFINIVKESNGKIIFIIDIEYLLNFIIKMKTQTKPNHLIDIILFKLSNISNIYILNRNDKIQNNLNLFYLQLDKCLANPKYNNINYMEKNIIVYKSINESICSNVFWNVLEPGKISKFIGKIKSPIETLTYFNLVKINDEECFVKKIFLHECIDKNLFDLDKNPGIIIDPLDRFLLNIYQ